MRRAEARRETDAKRGDVCVGGKIGRLFCIEEVFIERSKRKRKQKSQL